MPARTSEATPATATAGAVSIPGQARWSWRSPKLRQGYYFLACLPERRKRAERPLTPLVATELAAAVEVFRTRLTEPARIRSSPRTPRPHGRDGGLSNEQRKRPAARKNCDMHLFQGSQGMRWGWDRCRYLAYQCRIVLNPRFPRRLRHGVAADIPAKVSRSEVSRCARMVLLVVWDLWSA